MLENIFNNADDEKKQNSADQTENRNKILPLIRWLPGQMKIIEPIKNPRTQNSKWFFAILQNQRRFT
jgi:hypothetical protein